MSFKENIQIIKSAHKCLEDACGYLGRTNQSKALSADAYFASGQIENIQNLFDNFQRALNDARVIDEVKKRDGERFSNNFLLNKGEVVLKTIDILLEKEEITKELNTKPIFDIGIIGKKTT